MAAPDDRAPLGRRPATADEGAGPGWVDEKTAADYIGYKPQTLTNWRSRRQGPKYSKVHGKSIRYRLADLDAWLDANSRPR